MCQQVRKCLTVYLILNNVHFRCFDRRFVRNSQVLFISNRAYISSRFTECLQNFFDRETEVHVPRDMTSCSGTVSVRKATVNCCRKSSSEIVMILFQNLAWLCQCKTVFQNLLNCCVLDSVSHSNLVPALTQVHSGNLYLGSSAN